jgi:TatD DNase family protein
LAKANDRLCYPFQAEGNDVVSLEPRSRQIREAIKDGTLPLDKVIIETDAPYMVPSLPLSQLDETSRMLLMRCREGRNEPCTLPVIVKTIAKCMGREAKEVARVTTANAARVFGLTAPQV